MDEKGSQTKQSLHGEETHAKVVDFVEALRTCCIPLYEEIIVSDMSAYRQIVRDAMTTSAAIAKTHSSTV